MEPFQIYTWSVRSKLQNYNQQTSALAFSFFHIAPVEKSLKMNGSLDSFSFVPKKSSCQRSLCFCTAEIIFSLSFSKISSTWKGKHGIEMSSINKSICTIQTDSDPTDPDLHHGSNRRRLMGPWNLSTCLYPLSLRNMETEDRIKDIISVKTCL